MAGGAPPGGPDIAPRGPDLEEALLNLGTALQMLTNLSLQSVAQIVPHDEGEDHDDLMAEHYNDIMKACSQLKLNSESLSPQWNKSYGGGPGQTYWVGDLRDGRDRGEIPYFCPSGW